ncbi:MAG: STAS domain-containing protein [Candidatus Acidiferrales bacterium]|jgi:anti-sigma B factor antagonist
MPNENLQIVTSPGSRDGSKILRIKGPLNIHTIFEFQNALRAESSSTLIIDFAEVPFIDSTGLGAMVGAHLAAQKVNRKIVFAAMNSQVKALLDMTHVSQFFNTYPTIDDAETAVR